VEEIAAYFWRREGISGVSLRFPGVYRVGGRHATRRAEFMQRQREAMASFMALPEAERKVRVADAVERSEEFRAQRLKELPFEEQRRRWEKMREEGPPPPEMMLCWGRTDFWASINVLDAAQAIEKGLTADYEGSHVLFVNDSHNAMGMPSRLLVEYCFPEVTEWKREINGTETLVSIERARALIGFEPEHSIHDLISDVG
jgi:nucleoside-diphosphate-sugar epimerase